MSYEPAELEKQTTETRTKEQDPQPSGSSSIPLLENSQQDLFSSLESAQEKPQDKSDSTFTSHKGNSMLLSICMDWFI